MAQLEHGELHLLCHRFADSYTRVPRDRQTVLCDAPLVESTALPSDVCNWYYIAAGIGSGIREASKEGYHCLGACEKDEYCQQV